jgi:hypothetical protein
LPLLCIHVGSIFYGLHVCNARSSQLVFTCCKYRFTAVYTGFSCAVSTYLLIKFTFASFNIWVADVLKLLSNCDLQARKREKNELSQIGLTLTNCGRACVTTTTKRWNAGNALALRYYKDQRSLFNMTAAGKDE